MMKFSMPINFHLKRRLENIALFLSIPLIGLLDGIGDGRIRLTAFFLIPIMLVTWRVGRRAGYLTTFAALITLLVVSYIDKPKGTNNLLFAVDTGGRFISFFIIVAILSNLHSSFVQQKTKATRDALTTLYNRLGLQEILNVELEIARREMQPFAVFFLDCDNFKEVNDQWGHDLGDELLKTVALTLTSSIRRSDIACRLGGDEFVVYAGNVGEHESVRLISKIKTNLDAAMLNRQWPVTFSIGAAIFESPPDTLSELLRFADSLMYEAKKGGKDSLRVAKWVRGFDGEHRVAKAV